MAGSLAWEAVRPDDDVVGHFAAIARSIADGGTVETASEGYIREVFDDYAERFDEHLSANPSALQRVSPPSRGSQRGRTARPGQQSWQPSVA